MSHKLIITTKAPANSMCVSFISIYSLEFGPTILVSRSWICLTSSEMCCSRSLFCSSSWWTRAWASSRAVASALSWSFNRCTYRRTCRCADKWRRERRRDAESQHSVFTFPRSQLTRLVQLPLDLLCAPNTMCLSEKSVARFSENK